MAMSAALVKRHGFGILEGIFTLTPSGSYATGGDSLDFALVMGFTNRQPTWVQLEGIAGFVYQYDKVNKKVLVFQSGAGVFTGSALATHRHNLHLNNADVADGATTRINAGSNLLGANTGADLLVTGVPNTAGVGGIVDVSAGTPAGTVAASIPSELAAGAYPAGITGDTISARVAWFQ